MIQTDEIRHAHFFCGLAGGAKGFNRGSARVGSCVAKFRCIGGIDSDPAAIRDFSRIAGIPGTVMDLFSRDQYIAFHGREPPPNWREATRADILKAFGNERPHIIFLSAPCKGFSGLLSESRSKSGKYQALNQLALRGLFLALDAWHDDPPEFILFENVPRIATRGRPLLDQIEQLLSAYGYASAETTHDCGALGNLAQSRKRFLLVARHVAKVPPFLYEPPQRPLRAVGEVLGRMLLPGDPAGGPMHRVPSLHWRTWVRLAFVEAGKDWRSLQRLAVDNGFLRDYAIEAAFRTTYGVCPWDEPTGTITGGPRPSKGEFSVADQRIEQSADYGQLGVRSWDESTGTVSGQSTVGGGAHAIADPRYGTDWASGQFGVNPWDAAAGVITSQRSPGQGRFAVADPRLPRDPNGPRFNNVYRIVRWDQTSRSVTGGGHPTAGGIAVADPRTNSRTHSALGVGGWNDPAHTIAGESFPTNGQFSVADPRPAKQPTELHGKYHITPYGAPSRAVIAGRDNGASMVADPRPENDWKGGKYRVTAMDESAGTVIAESGTGNGAYAVADPRPGLSREHGGDYLTAGHYGVVPWEEPAGAVTGTLRHDNGPGNVADPRLPAPTDRLIAVIRSIDGTWHRPFTTLELAALQGLLEPEEQLELDGLSDSAWRERIGNAVPSPAAEAIAGVIGTTLLLAWSGETFALGSTPIWVRPVAIALMAARRYEEVA